MSGAVDVLDTIRTLATLVRLHEGNRDQGVNGLLSRAEDCCAAVAELITACEIAVQTLIVSCQPAGNPDVDDAEEIRSAVYTLRDSLSRVQGGTP